MTTISRKQLIKLVEDQAQELRRQEHLWYTDATALDKDEIAQSFQPRVAAAIRAKRVADHAEVVLRAIRRERGVR